MFSLTRSSRTARFCTSGIALSHLIHGRSSDMSKEMAKRNDTAGMMQDAIEQALMEAEELRQMLALTYVVHRLLRTFDWSMQKYLFGSVEDFIQQIHLSRGFDTAEELRRMLALTY